MRIIHTADWHIGQELHGFSRRFEHETFLSWLIEQCRAHQPEALLIAGDIFHHANPSNEALEQFARFTERARASCPAMQIIAVAGNHDSPARFDALVPLVRDGVRLIGAVPRLGNDYDLDRLLIPVGHGAILAAPYLRLSDLPAGGEDTSIAMRMGALYDNLWKAAAGRLGGAPCVVTGHLHVRGGRESESERPILIGGEQAAPPEVFPAEAAYVALGHLHLPQQLHDGRIRYSGAPIPLSATERSYKHEIVLLDIAQNGQRTAQSILVPRSVPHLRLPEAAGIEPQLALDLLKSTLGDHGIPLDAPAERWPFVEIHLRLDKPAPKIAAQLIEDAGRARLPARIVKVSVELTNAAPLTPETRSSLAGLAGHTPASLFPRAFAAVHGGQAPGPEHLEVLRAAIQEVAQ